MSPFCCRHLAAVRYGPQVRRALFLARALAACATGCNARRRRRR